MFVGDSNPGPRQLGLLKGKDLIEKFGNSEETVAYESIADKAEEDKVMADISDPASTRDELRRHAKMKRVPDRPEGLAVYSALQLVCNVSTETSLCHVRGVCDRETGMYRCSGNLPM